MELVLAAAAAAIVFLYGRSHSWWGAAASPASQPVVCDLESDMPDALKQAVLAQVASQKNVATLRAFAASLAQADYIQAAYCLNQRAWVLSGKTTTPPVAPTAAQITAAHALRAINGQDPANLGQMGLGQMQVAPGTPDLTATVGTLIAVIGATPYDAASNPHGFAAYADPTVASIINGTTYALVGPGTIHFAWPDGTSTTITSTTASQASAANVATAAAKAPAPGLSLSPPGLDPNSIQAAVDSLGNLAKPSIPTSTPSMPSQTSGFAHRNSMV